MILSKQIGQEKLKYPTGYENIPTYQLIAEMGLVNFPYSGFPFFLPIGLKIIRKIQRIISEAFECHGFSEIYAPLIQHQAHLNASGRLKNVEKELFYLNKDFFLTPTNEEFFLNFCNKGLSYRHLPLRFFQIADKFRNIKKPKGILRSKQFLMCDAVSIDGTPEDLNNSRKLFEVTVKEVFEALGVPIVQCIKNNNNYVDYLFICLEGETKLKKNENNTFEFSDESTQYNGSSVAMYFIFDSESLLPIAYTRKNGHQHPVKTGTYGFGLQRCLHAVVHQHRDSLGINWPKSVRPFDISLLPINTKDVIQMEKSYLLYEQLKHLNILFDDRFSMDFKARASFSDFMGVPTKLLIGSKEVEQGFITVKKRGQNQVHTIPIEHIKKWLENNLE